MSVPPFAYQGAPVSSDELAIAATSPLKPDGPTLSGRFVSLTAYTPAHDHGLWRALSGEPYLGSPAWDADALLWRYLSFGPHPPPSRIPWEGFPAAQSARDTGDRRLWVVRLLPTAPWPAAWREREDAPIVGMVALVRHAPRDLCTEVGMLAFTAAVQGTPVNSEAVFLLQQHVFETLKFRRCEWKAHASNARSIAAAGRLGFVHEGTFRHHMLACGVLRNTWWSSLLSEEWEAVKQRNGSWLASEAAPALFAKRVAQLQGGWRL